jgi:hypothetical protein
LSKKKELMMKNFVVIVALAVGALVLPHPSQAAGIPANGIPGYYNTATSTFVPLVIKSAPAAAPVNRTGTLKITINLTIESAIGTDEPISCSASTETFDSSFSNSAGTSGIITRTGSTGTLTMLIPYDWTMANSGELATITVSCEESGFETAGVGHTVGFSSPGFTVPTTKGALTSKTFTASM